MSDKLVPPVAYFVDMLLENGTILHLTISKPAPTLFMNELNDGVKILEARVSKKMAVSADV